MCTQPDTRQKSLRGPSRGAQNWYANAKMSMLCLSALPQLCRDSTPREQSGGQENRAPSVWTQEEDSALRWVVALYGGGT